MKKHLFFILLFLLSIMLLASCKKKDLTIKHATYFSGSTIKGVYISGPLDVQIIQDSIKNYIVLEYPKYLEDDICVNLDNYNYAHLTLDDFPYIGHNFAVSATIYVTSLEEIHITKAANVAMIGDYHSNSTNIDISKASKLRNANSVVFNVNNCYIDINDASSFKGTITAHELLNLNIDKASEFTNGNAIIPRAIIFANNASKIRMLETEVLIMDIELRNASSCHAYVTEELTCKLTNASSLYYKGSPILRQVEVYGGSKIHPIH